MDISCVIVATISLEGYTSTFIMTCLWLPTRIPPTTRIYIFKEHEICRRPTDQREVIVRIYRMCIKPSSKKRKRMCIKPSSKKRKQQSPSGSFVRFVHAHQFVGDSPNKVCFLLDVNSSLLLYIVHSGLLLVYC